MSNTDTQTVVTETNGQAQPGTEATDARTGDELDDLLRQFETEAQPSKPSPSTPEADKPGAATDPNLQKEFESLRTEFARMSSKADMEATIKAIRGDLDPEVFDDVFIESWLNAQAQTDPRLQRAWAERHNNPKQFDKVRSQLGKGFSQKFKNLPDKNATEDREAVAAAVRGASNRAPEGKAPSFGGMSNAEFSETVKKEYGFDPGV